jgi:cytochrome c5
MRGAVLALTALAAIVLQPTAGAVAADAPQSEGERLFHAKCGVCHEGMTSGVIMLGKRLGPDKRFLADRTDLEPAYVKIVVRQGLRGMPPITRVEVTNPELDQIIGYLTRNNPPARPGGAP